MPSGYRTAVSELTKGQALYFGDDMPVLVTTPYIAPDEIAWAAAQIPASVRPLDVPEAQPRHTDGYQCPTCATPLTLGQYGSARRRGYCKACKPRQ